MDLASLSEIVAAIIQDLMNLGNHATQLVLRILPWSIPPALVNIVSIAIYGGLVFVVLKVMKAKVLWFLLGTLWFLSLNILGLADTINRFLSLPH